MKPSSWMNGISPLLLGLTLLAPEARGALLAYESFEGYTPGWELHQLDNDLPGWVRGWEDGGAGILRATVTETSLAVPEIGYAGIGPGSRATSWDAARSFDGGALDLNGDLEIDDGSVVWYSTLFRIEIPWVGQRILWLSSSGGSSKLGVGFEVKVPQDTEAKVVTVEVNGEQRPLAPRLFIAGPHGNSPPPEGVIYPPHSWNYLPIEPERTYLVIGRVEFHDAEKSDIHQLWVNPVDYRSEAGLGVPLLELRHRDFHAVADFVTSTLYMRGVSVAYPWFVDELRLGTTLADVILPTAQPVAFADQVDGWWWDGANWLSSWRAVTWEAHYPFAWHGEMGGWIYLFPQAGGDCFVYSFAQGGFFYVNPWWYPFVYDFTAGQWGTHLGPWRWDPWEYCSPNLAEPCPPVDPIIWE